MWFIKGDTGSLDYSSYQGHRASINEDNIMGIPGIGSCFHFLCKVRYLSTGDLGPSCWNRL